MGGGSIKTYYLIDFENVGLTGLKGNQKVVKEDEIMIFFSTTCCKIDMRELTECGSGCLKFIEIPAGNQSLDMHISSYIGYLSCRHKEEGCHIAVISKDRGYEAVIRHWNSTNVIIKSFHSINDAVTGTETENTMEAEVIGEIIFSTGELGKKKTENNNQIAKALSKGNLSQETIGKVSSICSKSFGQKNRKQLAYRGIVSSLGQKEGLVAYNLIKQCL